MVSGDFESGRTRRDKARARVDNVYFFSDETGQHSGGKYFLVCGAAISTHRIWTAEQLGHAERVSSKGKQDWKGTKNVGQRVRYIEEVLAIQNLKGTIFFAAYENNHKEYWDYTVDALFRVIQRFGRNRRSLIRHHALNFKSREKLKAALSSVGHRYEIQTGSEKRAEIRLADAICGYIGLQMYNSNHESAGLFPPIPDWFVDLKNEAPLQE